MFAHLSADYRRADPKRLMLIIVFTKHRRVLVSVYTVAETRDGRRGGVVVYCKHLHAAKPVTIIALDVVIVAPSHSSTETRELLLHSTWLNKGYYETDTEHHPCL